MQQQHSLLHAAWVFLSQSLSIRVVLYSQTLNFAEMSSPINILQTLSKEMNKLTLRRLMSYIYGAPILDVSRSHTTTQHSR